MYIVKKEIKGREYFYARKSIRKGKKVLSKNVAYLGKERKEAEKKLKELIGKKETSEEEKKEKKVYLIHGWGGSSRYKLFSWLKKELEGKAKIYSFDIPNTNNPKIDEWVEFLQENVESLDGNTYFVGHSIGCQTILRFLEQLKENVKIGGCVFIAGWFNLKNLEKEEEKIAEPWLKTKIDFDKVKKHCSNFLAIFSDNDSVVPLSDEKIFKEKLEAKTMVKRSQGHFDETEKLNEITNFLAEKKLKQIKPLTIDELAAFCKRKGFVFLSGEIYGGLAGFWDFGNVGVEMKNHIKKEWWKFFVQEREDVVGIDGSIITHPKTWEASGHTESFSDILVNCEKCKKANKIDKSELQEKKCDFCGGDLDKKNIKELNLMFSTQVSPEKKSSIKAYLRPETAQLIFTNFKQVAETSRAKLPFGIAQIGKAYRNEISPRDFLFRSREFEQMELEYFIMPGQKCPYSIPEIKVKILSAEMQTKGKEAEEMPIKEALRKGIIKRDWHAYWLANCLLWFKNLNCNLKNFRLRQHQKDELAHYSTDCWDLEYKFPFGWKELTGIADRGNYDLSRHEKFSGKDLKIFVEGKGKILPEVVAEPSFGVERAFLVFMFESYKYDGKRENVVLGLSRKLAPVKAAIFPIVRKKSFVNLAKKIYDDLKSDFVCIYDESGSIGRRYSRQDELGTPFCIAVDGDSLKKKDVTIRNKDDTKQIRVKISDLKEILRNLISEEINFEKTGKITETRKKQIKN